MAEMDVQSFDNLARLLGAQAAGDVLLLAVATACGDNVRLWNTARSAGIPWQRKSWTALSKLKEHYNRAVETARPPLLESEETVLWADRAEESESLVGGDAASSVARLIPSMPTHAPPWTHGKA